MDSLQKKQPGELLRAHGLSRTKTRQQVLSLLTSQSRPTSIPELQRRLQHHLDEATLYRTLNTFEKEGIVVRFDFGHGHPHYELAHDKPHHHHAICEQCGKIVDVPANDPPHLATNALRRAPGFRKIIRHSLELYGLCASCA